MADPQLFLIGTLCIIAAILLVARFSSSRAPDAETNRRADEPHILRKPWVLDGDTIDDKASKIRYRLANIDAPETGDNARCFRERQQGEVAKRAAMYEVHRAKVVAVGQTIKMDHYGRHVAHVFVDGQDLGELLIAKGLAVPWTGSRKKWCGPKGQLFELAQKRSESFACKACRHW